MRSVPSRSLFRNFWAGNTLPRTMPFMSGTRHSTSPMPCSRIQLSKLSTLVSEESGILHLGIGQIDGMRGARHEFFDLFVIDYKGRSEHHGIADCAHDEIIPETMVAAAQPDPGILGEEGAGFFIGGQFDG